VSNDNHVRLKRVGRRQVTVTLVGRRTEPEPKQLYDRRISTDDLPANANLAPIEVDDPYSPGERIIRMRSLRDDPLALLHSGGQIDDALYVAGRKWQALYERAEIGRVKSVDTRRRPVDFGGRVAEPLTDAQRRAAKLLRLAAGALEKSIPNDRARGRERVRIVQHILGRGLSPTQAAALRGEYGRYGVEKLSREFRRCLGVLAGSFEWQN
jgi:hypothetical protein